jgi:hypothetical protein
LEKKALDRILATMMPRMNPMRPPKRFFKGIFFNPFSVKRIKAARISPPTNPRRGIGGEGEKPWNR